MLTDYFHNLLVFVLAITCPQSDAVMKFVAIINGSYPHKTNVHCIAGYGVNGLANTTFFPVTCTSSGTWLQTDIQQCASEN